MLGAYVTVQDPVPWVVAVVVRAQLSAGVKLPVELVAKPTLPLGTIVVSVEMSLTVAVQLALRPTTMATGLQLTLAVVALLFTVRVNAAVVVLLP